MKKQILSLIVLVFLFACQKDEVFRQSTEENRVTPQKIESKADLNSLILNALKEGRYFKWTELNTDDLWTAIKLSDNKVNVFWSMDEVTSKSSKTIEDIILSQEGKNSKSDSPIFENSKILNYLSAEIANKQTLIDLLNSGDVEYIEPLYEMISEEEFLKSKGISIDRYMQIAQEKKLHKSSKSSFNAPLHPSFPNSKIDVAWNNGYDGKGITVAVIDNGPNENHPLFGLGVDNNKITNPISGETYTRTIEKYGFFKDNPFAFWQGWDGVYETGISITPTHGTAMLSVIGGAPNDFHFQDNNSGFWGTGVAYGSNLISIRSSRTVFIGLLSSRIGVRKAFESLIGRTDVKVISMSQGLVLWDEGIARAIRQNGDKLIFCAGGTFVDILLDVLVFGADFAGIDFDRSTITLFPAKMDEVYSATGVKANNDWCDDCFGKADFVVEFNDDDDINSDGDGGSSSVATASTAGMAALIWSTNPNLSPMDVYNKMAAISENPIHKDANFGHGRLDMGKFNDGFTAQAYIYLKGSNGKYVSSENGQQSMTCNRNEKGSWEKFELITLSDGKVAIKGSNGKFVSSENGERSMKCNRGEIGQWEKFELITLSEGRIALKGNNGRYVSSENGRRSMTCTRSAIGSWEQFIIYYE